MKKWFLLLMLVLGVRSVAQTGVVVTYYDGTTQQFLVETTGKLYFSDDNLQVMTTGSGSPTSIPVSIIRKITFDNNLGTVQVGENSHTLVLYPNPGTDTIRIHAPESGDMNVAIYSLEGRQIRKGKYASDEAIDISDLGTGIYLIQAGDVTFKFVKQ